MRVPQPLGLALNYSIILYRTADWELLEGIKAKGLTPSLCLVHEGVRLQSRPLLAHYGAVMLRF
jgi:hypothetical protein